MGGLEIAELAILGTPGESDNTGMMDFRTPLSCFDQGLAWPTLCLSLLDGLTERVPQADIFFLQGEPIVAEGP